MGAMGRQPQLRSGDRACGNFQSGRPNNQREWRARRRAIGFNYQVNAIVFGLEADASWTNLKGNGSFTTSAADTNWALENRLDWFGTVRGRAGFAVNDFLLYATGGAAIGQAKSSLVVTNLVPCCLMTANGSVTENLIGWTAGAGIEWMYSRSWSFKVEYLYVDLGSANYNFVGINFLAGIPHTTDSFPSDLKFNVVRAGVNYRF
jgi:outer membrane immunogenic protein